MTTSPAHQTAALVQIALVSLSQRNDPLITRVNNGGVLTSAESVAVFQDLFKLCEIMKASAAVIEDLDKEIEAHHMEISIMKVLLGLSDSETADKYDK